jgi:hypothetical protein
VRPASVCIVTQLLIHDPGIRLGYARAAYLAYRRVAAIRGAAVTTVALLVETIG